VNVINAKGCFTNTILITYPVSSGCEGGANEIWELVEVTTGYRALIADYKGTLVCMIAGPESGQNAGATPCTKPLQGDMEFRRPVVSESCFSGFYYIIRQGWARPGEKHHLLLEGLHREQRLVLRSGVSAGAARARLHRGRAPRRGRAYA
jgi:hypothetical protein